MGINGDYELGLYSPNFDSVLIGYGSYSVSLYLTFFIYKTEMIISHRIKCVTCLEQYLMYNKYSALNLSYYYLSLNPLSSFDEKL